MKSNQDVCQCECHQDMYIIHDAPCCEKCKGCGQMINLFVWDAHKTRCNKEKQ